MIQKIQKIQKNVMSKKLLIVISLLILSYVSSCDRALGQNQGRWLPCAQVFIEQTQRALKQGFNQIKNWLGTNGYKIHKNKINFDTLFSHEVSDLRDLFGWIKEDNEIGRFYAEYISALRRNDREKLIEVLAWLWERHVSIYVRVINENELGPSMLERFQQRVALEWKKAWKKITNEKKVLPIYLEWVRLHHWLTHTVVHREKGLVDPFGTPKDILSYQFSLRRLFPALIAVPVVDGVVPEHTISMMMAYGIVPLGLIQKDETADGLIRNPYDFFLHDLNHFRFIVDSLSLLDPLDRQKLTLFNQFFVKELTSHPSLSRAMREGLWYFHFLNYHEFPEQGFDMILKFLKNKKINAQTLSNLMVHGDSEIVQELYIFAVDQIKKEDLSFKKLPLDEQLILARRYLSQVLLEYGRYLEQFSQSLTVVK